MNSIILFIIQKKLLLLINFFFIRSNTKIDLELPLIFNEIRSGSYDRKKKILDTILENKDFFEKIIKVVGTTINKDNLIDSISDMLNYIIKLKSDRIPTNNEERAIALELMSKEVMKQIINKNPIGLHTVLEFMSGKMNFMLLSWYDFYIIKL